MNAGRAAGNAFKALDKAKQADVLAGRATLDVPKDPTLPPGCPRREWIGSGGGLRCDGCTETLASLRRFEDDPELELDVCKRCRYAACESCRVHHSRGTCYCKDSNFDFVYPPEAEREWYHTGYW